jgi:hypothetical protein
MFDHSSPQTVRPRFSSHFTMRRILVRTAMVLYCVALFLAFDFVYSIVTRGQEKEGSPRIANTTYHHGFAPNFDGFDIWGEARYRLITNSLGFKDGATRNVPLKASSHRVLLMGDSFAEGIGMTFEDSFAGLLYRAGQERTEKTEFLNAAVASYSPTIYYKKIKYLLDSGLTFDEVVLFADTSDVLDEATSYFCIDENPKYRVYCTMPPGTVEAGAAQAVKSNFFIDHFAVTNRVRITIKKSLQSFNGRKRAAINTDHKRIGWVIPGLDLGNDYQPLGVEGGIARSMENMKALSDLLMARKIPLTVVVYPWAQQLAQGDRDSRQISLWREICLGRCKAFINLYPVFFAAKEADRDWYEHLYILGDDHFSAAGNRMVFQEVVKYLVR